ncbi:MAG: hypothetical protein ACYCYI_05585 [Saccharofermentanales bacterium]
MFFTPKPLKELNSMLNKAGFKTEKPDIYLLWKVFKQFSNVKFNVADDALLFQCGTYNFTGKDIFYWELIRQFSFEKNGEYDHMEQLHIEFLFDPAEDLAAFQDTVWTYDFESLKEFYENVEEHDSFNYPWKKYEPRGIKIFQEHV